MIAVLQQSGVCGLRALVRERVLHTLVTIDKIGPGLDQVSK